MVWHQLKSKVRRQNVYANQPEKVLQLLRESCDEITGEHWSNYVEYVMNEELRFRERDNFLDNEIDSVVVDLTDNEYDDDIYEDDVLYSSFTNLWQCCNDPHPKISPIALFAFYSLNYSLVAHLQDNSRPKSPTKIETKRKLQEFTVSGW